jgi:magnesium chelatase family protein
LSGPLLDRIDLLVNVSPAPCGEQPELGRPATPGPAGRVPTTSARSREAVLEARTRQLARCRAGRSVANADLDARALEVHVRLDERGQRLLTGAQQRRLLSTRGAHRTLRVARTVADLAGSDSVRAEHVATALALRPEPCGARAAVA